MYVEIMTSDPSLLDSWNSWHVDNLLFHIQLNKSMLLVFLVPHKRLSELASQLTNVAQPWFQRTEVVLFESSLYSSTTEVSWYDDVLDSKMFDRILYNCQNVDVRWRSYIGDIAMYENLSWFQTHNLVGRYSRVRANYP